MFCIVAFIILAIIGIFSASYRELAREALACVLRRVTLRPCTTGFDQKMKSRILGSVINRSETAARIINKNFEFLSWTLFLLMLASTAYAMRGAYLFYVTGSCSGLNETSFCLLDPKGENSRVSGIDNSCRVKPTTVADLTLRGVNLAGFPTLKGGGEKRVVLVGCYGCTYTRKVYGSIKKLARENGATFVFADYPVKVKSTLTARLGHCVYERDPVKYWRLNDVLFSTAVANLDDPAFARKATADLGLDWGEIGRCVEDPASEAAITSQMEEISQTNFFGTPTVFIGNQAFVGPKPYRVYAISLGGLLYWLR